MFLHQWSTTIRPSVTSFLLSPGTSSLLMNEMVSIMWTQTSIPCASLLISFPYKVRQTLLYFGFCNRCQYFINLPVSPSVIAPANSHNSFIGGLWDANDRAYSGTPFVVPMSMHDNIISCVNVLVFLVCTSVVGWHLGFVLFDVSG